MHPDAPMGRWVKSGRPSSGARVGLLAFSFFWLITTNSPGEVVNPPPPGNETVNLFELIFAYRLGNMEYTGLQAYPVDKIGLPFFWIKDEIIKLIDSDKTTSIKFRGAEGFSASFRLESPIEVHGISISTPALQLNSAVSLHWKLMAQDSPDSATGVVAQGVLSGLEMRCDFPQPRSLQEFHLTVATTNPPPKGADAFSFLNNVSLFAPKQVVGLRLAPSTQPVLDPQFHPYKTAPGQKFRLRAWAIDSTGEAEEIHAGLTWKSSDLRVLRIAADGQVLAVQPGRATVMGVSNARIRGKLEVIVENPGFVDLDVIHIERWIRQKDGQLVKRNWDAKINAPQPGEKQLFRAHFINAGTKNATRLTARWWADGKFSGSRAVNDLAPAGELVRTGETTAEDIPLLRHQHEMTLDFLEIPVDGQRHAVVFALTSMRDPDSNPDNNQLAVWSDALAFGYFMNESAYHAYARIQTEGWKNLPDSFIPPHHEAAWAQAEWEIRSSTAYDLVQRFVRVFNRQFEISQYPLTPRGITERLAGALHIIPDDAMRKDFNDVCARFGQADHTLDLVWGHFYVPGSTRAQLTYANLLAGFHEGRLPYVSTPYIHEVGHARYLVDLYGSGIFGDEIFILDEQGQRVFPDTDKLQYERATRMGTGTPRACMMMGDYLHGWCEHSAYAWERIRGRRARGGSWNAPESIGEYLNAIPQTNLIRIVTPDGKPVSQARVEIYQSETALKTKRIYPKIVDNEVDLRVTTDERGEALLGANPFVADRSIPSRRASEKWHPKQIAGNNGQVNAIVKITHADKSHYKFLTVLDSNLGYWHKYGLDHSGYPYFPVRPDSRLTYEYTIDPAWDAEQERTHRTDKPKVE